MVWPQSPRGRKTFTYMMKIEDQINQYVEEWKIILGRETGGSL